jgi:general secretion pathway protein J
MKRTYLKRAGFTLVEMLLAIAIFVLLVGAVYTVVSVAVTASSNLGEEQMEARKLGAFQDFLRRGFVNLPVEAEISLRARSRGSLGKGMELVIRPAAGAFEVGPASGQGSGVVLGTISDKEGTQFSVARFPARLDQDALTQYLDKALWMPILSKVDSLRWRFWDKNLNQFVETWDKGQEHPEMIELTMGVGGEPPFTSIFRLPALSQTSLRP